MAEGNSAYCNDDCGVLFDRNKTTLIKYPRGSATKAYAIPVTVTGIGDHAFKQCAALTDVYYGNDEESWAKVTIGTENDPLASTEIHYLDLSQVSVAEVNGEITFTIHNLNQTAIIN